MGGLSSEDYDEIEKAVMETERGRWFLTEFAKRQRSEDTQMLLEAIRKLEDSVRAPPLREPDSAASESAPPRSNDFYAQDEELFEGPPAGHPLPKLVVPQPDSGEAPASERKRIVIIRRAASETVDIPLAKDAASG